MEAKTKTPVDSIEIPAEYVDLCDDWHGGISCKLYAVSSTGGLTCGSIRPTGCDTDEQWYLTLWRGLACDISYTTRQAEKSENKDHCVLAEFEKFCDSWVERLTEEYGLADWES